MIYQHCSLLTMECEDGALDIFQYNDDKQDKEDHQRDIQIFDDCVFANEQLKNPGNINHRYHVILSSYGLDEKEMYETFGNDI